MKFRPLHNWVVIRRIAPAEMSAGGIIIPEAARTRPVEGWVEAVGPGSFKEHKKGKEKEFMPTVLKPGQKVMFIEYMAKEITLDGSDVTVISEDDILGIVESSGALTVKEHYHVEVKKSHPPMVQAGKQHDMGRKPLEAEVTFRKVSKPAVKAKKSKPEPATSVKTKSAKKTAAAKKAAKKK